MLSFFPRDVLDKILKLIEPVSEGFPTYSTSRYIDDPLNVDNPYFEGTVCRIYPPELQLNTTNASDTEAPFF